MSQSFSVAEARLAGLIVESVILGLYLITFSHTLRSLLHTGTRWRRFQEINTPLILVALLMFTNVILGFSMTVQIVWRAFIREPDRTQSVLGDLTNWAFVLKVFGKFQSSTTLLSQTTIGDAMLIYRCWVVYNRSWLAITISFLIWLGGTVCSVFLIYYQATHNPNALISAAKLLPFGIAFWALTVALNIITTTLLVWPIWKVARRHDELAYRSTNASTYTNTMKDVMYVIIESGLMYTIAAFVTFVTYAIKHNSLYIASNAEVGIAGIAFNLIINRTAKVKRAKALPSFSGSLPLHIIRPPRHSTILSDRRVRVTITRASSMDEDLQGQESDRTTLESKARADSESVHERASLS